MKKIFYSILGTFSLFVMPKIFADELKLEEELIGDISGFGLPKINTPSADGAGLAMALIIQYAIGLAGILAIIACTWAAIQMFIATGDEKKFEDAKKLLIHALVGVGIAGGAYAIVSVITGISL